MPNAFQLHGAILSGSGFDSPLCVKVYCPKNCRMSHYGSTHPAAQQSNKFVDSNATQSRHHCHINNYKMDRTSALQNHSKVVQKYKSQVSDK
jgi:hypothetical protein